MEKIVVGVWKDKLGLAESSAIARELGDLCSDLDVSGFVAAVAPAPYAAFQVNAILQDSPLDVVYQDVHWPAVTGSYMGSTPIRVLPEMGIRYSMVGHSERRRFFGEDDASIRRKLAGLVGNDLVPILCVGDDVEDWSERREILQTQIAGALRSPGLEPVDIRRIVIAYEPVWAISTWRSDRALPTGEEVAAMLNLVRDITREVTDSDVLGTRFLFGGSVGPANADEYFAVDGVDGALVGGASLKADSMAAVFRSASRAWNS